jgi:hypothetical protein
MNRVSGAIGGGKGPLAAMLLAAGVVATGCGDAGVAPPSQNAPASQTASAAELPDGESASGSLDGTEFAATRISQCQATPGYGLGIRASTADFAAQDDRGVQLFGGFEKEEGRITVDFRGSRWTAGEGTDGGSLEFSMTDVRDQLREFVTVRTHGTMISDQGESVPFNLTLVCEPGGT